MIKLKIINTIRAAGGMRNIISFENSDKNENNILE